MIRRFAVALSLGICVIALQPTLALSENSKPDTYKQLTLFGDVFERVRAEYVTETKDKDLVEAAINGMLTSLDPHSSFLNEDNFREMQVQTKGEFGGLGIEVTMENGLVKVVSPIDDTPAAKAGIQPNDYITHIDGEPVLGLLLSDAVDKMRGKIGSTIKLTIRREGTPEAIDVSMKRDIIKIQSVKSSIQNNIGIIRVSSFSENTASGAKKAIDEFNKQLGNKLQGVVIDMRNNPGGLLDQAIELSDLFLDKGEVVSTRGRKVEEAQRYNAKAGDALNGLPMVVLINGGSASASEIVAGALKDHSRAVVMGTKSFGKGSVQTVIPLSGNVAMRLTTAYYYTPSGVSIQQKGIEPDIEVLAAKIDEIADASRRSEADLKGALANPNDPADKGEIKATVMPGTPIVGAPKDKKPFDYQMSRALDLIRGVQFFRGQRADK
jgi:carboxyl-terminal processing protease